MYSADCRQKGSSAERGWGPNYVCLDTIQTDVRSSDRSGERHGIGHSRRGNNSSATDWRRKHRGGRAVAPFRSSGITSVGPTLSGGRAPRTYVAAALVNKAYLRLVGDQGRDRRNRAHFVGVTAGIMRRILIDHARRKGTQALCRRKDGRNIGRARRDFFRAGG